MSQAPSSSSEDSQSDKLTAFLKANTRREELLRNGVSFSGQERNCCFLNTGAESFANISAASGLDHIGDGRAYALVDWDHDGDLDLWATNRTAPRVQFLRNNAADQYHFLSVKLQGNGTTTNRDAVGARVELVLKDNDAEKLIKTVRAGEGFLAQSSKRVHFGLGSANEIDRLIVHWPGGEMEEFANLDADRHYTISQGSSEVRPWSRPAGDVQLAASQNEPPRQDEQARIQLRYRIPLPVLEYETVEGENRSIGPRVGSPTLVNLWASWCQPCLKELVELKKNEESLRATGLEIVALSVDELAKDDASNPQAARAFLQRQEFPFKAGFATNVLIRNLEATFYYLFDFRRPWAVPTSLLLDRRGQLAMIYVGPVDVDTLISDINQLTLDDPSWLTASLPFDGRWVGEVRHPNLTALIKTFINRELVDSGLQLVDRFADTLVADPDASGLLVRLATSLGDEGHVVKAKRRLRQAIEADPVNAAAQLQLGKLLVQLREFDEAMQHCREAVRLRPNDPKAQFFLANLLDSQGDKKGALEHFERTVELQPDAPKARFALGNAYAGRLEWDKASEQLLQAAQLEPENASVHYQLARVLQKSGQTGEAIPHFQHALNLKSDSGDIHYSLGAALAAVGKKKDGIRHLRRAHELQPDSLLVLNGLAWILATTEQTSPADKAEALRVAKQAARKTQHSHPQILDTLAAAYAATGDFDQAVSTAQKAVALAGQGGAKELAQEIRTHLEQYRRGRPYRDAAREEKP